MHFGDNTAPDRKGGFVEKLRLDALTTQRRDRVYNYTAISEQGHRKAFISGLVNVSIRGVDDQSYLIKSATQVVTTAKGYAKDAISRK